MKYLFLSALLFLVFDESQNLLSQCSLPTSCSSAQAGSAIAVTTSTTEIDYETVVGCVAANDILTDVAVGTKVYDYAMRFYIKFSAAPESENILLHTSSLHDGEPIVTLYDGSCAMGDVFYTSLPDRSPNTDLIYVSNGGGTYIAEFLIPLSEVTTDSVEVVVDIAALGEVSSCDLIGYDGKHELSSFEVVARTSPLTEEVFLPGESVTFLIRSEFIRPADFSGEWLHSVIPTFGTGWDLQSVELAEVLLSSSTSIAPIWYDDSNCPLESAVSLGNFCIYENDEGQSVLCNMLTENCPCRYQGVVAGQSMPPGWVLLTTNSSCGQGCSPSLSWGGGASTIAVEMELTLKVRDAATSGEDLQINLARFSDAVTGCYVPGNEICEPEFTVRSPVWQVADDSVSFVVLSTSAGKVCTDSTVLVDLHLLNISEGEYFMQLVPEDGLIATTPPTIYTASTTIGIDVQNTAADDRVLEVQVWELVGTDSILMSTVDVTVRPVYEVFVSELTVCFGSCTGLVITDNHGGNGLYDLEGGLIICAPDTLPKAVMAVSEFCGVDTDTVRLTVLDEIEVALTTPRPVCMNGMVETGDDQYLIVLDTITGGTAPYDISWQSNPLHTATEVDGKFALLLNEESISSIFSRRIRITVQDSVGCEQDTLVILEILDDVEIDEGVFCKDGIYDPSQPEILLELPAVEGRERRDVTWLKLGTIVSGPVTDSTYIVNEEESNTVGEVQVRAVVEYDDGCENEIDFDFLIFTGTRMFTSNIVDFEVDFAPEPAIAILSVMWDFGDGNTSDEFFPTHIYEASGAYEVTMQAIDMCDTSVWTSTVLVIGTDVYDMEQYSAVAIYPVPASVSAVLTCPPALVGQQYTIRDVTGVCVAEGATEGVTTVIELSHIASGLYILTMVHENEVFTCKIIKE